MGFPITSLKLYHSHCPLLQHLLVMYMSAQVCGKFDKMSVYMLDDPGFKSCQGQEIFLFSKMSRQAVNPTHSSVEWVPDDFSSEGRAAIS